MGFEEKVLLKLQAEVAHLVEHDLAKVGVAGSSPVFRSQKLPPETGVFLCICQTSTSSALQRPRW
jgi:hypothetical protein